jgi:hypothetical protein
MVVKLTKCSPSVKCVGFFFYYFVFSFKHFLCLLFLQTVTSSFNSLPALLQISAQLLQTFLPTVPPSVLQQSASTVLPVFPKPATPNYSDCYGLSVQLNFPWLNCRQLSSLSASPIYFPLPPNSIIPGSAQLLPAQLSFSRLSSASPGSAQLLPAQLSFSWLSSASLGSAQLLQAQLNFSRLSSASPGSVQLLLAQQSPMPTLLNLSFAQTIFSPLAPPNLPSSCINRLL